MPWWAVLISFPIVVRSMLIPLYARSTIAAEKMKVCHPNLCTSLNHMEIVLPALAEEYKTAKKLNERGIESRPSADIFGLLSFHPVSLLAYPLGLFIHMGVYQAIYRLAKTQYRYHSTSPHHLTEGSMAHEGIPLLMPDLTQFDSTHICLITSITCVGCTLWLNTNTTVLTSIPISHSMARSHGIGIE